MRKALLLITVSVFALAILIPSAQGFFFGSIFVVSGTITFQGKPAPPELSVAAYINQEKVAESKTKEEGKYELRIPEYDPANPQVKGYHSYDDVIQVKLEGREAKPTFHPRSENLKVDLKVETSLDVKLSTWGKIKALFK